MTNKEIQSLIQLISDSNLSEFKLKKDDLEISIRTDKYIKNATQVVQSAPPAVNYAPPSVATATPAAATPQASSPTPAPPAAKADDESRYIKIKSPIVGTFYQSASPEKPPYIKIGDTVSVGDVVCIVEAMKLFNEIESEVAGKVVKMMIEDASPVEYDQVLYLVDPKG